MTETRTTQETEDDTESVNVDGDMFPITQSTVSLGSEARTETTESTRSLVQRNMAKNDKETTEQLADTAINEREEFEQERENTPPSDTTVAPSIGPVVLKNVKKRRKLQRTCA